MRVAASIQTTIDLAFALRHCCSQSVRNYRIIMVTILCLIRLIQSDRGEDRRLFSLWNFNVLYDFPTLCEHEVII